MNPPFISEPVLPMTAFNSTTSTALQGVRVLLVDDYPINLKMAQRCMQKWGMEVDVAENGAVAVERCSVGQYDLILMDLEMPVMDGYIATQIIRTFNVVVPILALTASAPFSNENRAFAVGMTDYVTKPFSPNELLQKLVQYSQK